MGKRHVRHLFACRRHARSADVFLFNHLTIVGAATQHMHAPSLVCPEFWSSSWGLPMPWHAWATLICIDLLIDLPQGTTLTTACQNCSPRQHAAYLCGTDDQQQHHQHVASRKQSVAEADVEAAAAGPPGRVFSHGSAHAGTCRSSGWRRVQVSQISTHRDPNPREVRLLVCHNTRPAPLWNCMPHSCLQPPRYGKSSSRGAQSIMLKQKRPAIMLTHSAALPDQHAVLNTQQLAPGKMSDTIIDA